MACRANGDSKHEGMIYSTYANVQNLNVNAILLDDPVQDEQYLPSMERPAMTSASRKATVLARYQDIGFKTIGIQANIMDRLCSSMAQCSTGTYT